MLATRWKQPFSSPEWLFEVKWDGVRVILAFDGRTTTLTSRRGLDLSDAYVELTDLELDRPCVLDGEAIAFNDDGNPSFERLQQRTGVTGFGRVAAVASQVPVHFVAFDCLWDSKPLIDQPLEVRLEHLDRLEGKFVPSERIAADGEALFDAIETRGLEGMVAKRRASVYRPGLRTPDWRKIPNVTRMRTVVGGYVRGQGGRAAQFGSLLMGLWDGGELRYVGSVGSGFDGRTLEAMREALGQLARDDSPFAPGSDLPTDIGYVEPGIVIEVEFKEWTGAGRLRAPVFKGVSDAPPDEVTWAAEGPDA